MSRWLRTISLSVLLAFVPLATRGADGGAQPAPSAPRLTFSAPFAAPEKSTALVWKFGEKLTPGRWYTDTQVERIANQIWGLEDALAKQNVQMERVKADARVTAAAGGMPRWVWITAGLVVGIGVGVGTGYYVWGR